MNLEKLESGPEMAQHLAQNQPNTKAPEKTRLGKTHVDYWKARLSKREYNYKGQTVTIPNWHIRLSHLGRREWFNLQTPNAAAAASKAKEIYIDLIGKGWDATLEKHKGELSNSKEDMTIPEFADVYRDALKLMDYPPSKRSAERYLKDFAYLCRTVGVTRISGLTREAIEQFKADYLSDARKAGRQETNIKNSLNAILRNSGALFSRQACEALRQGGISLQNPFAGQKLRRIPIETYSPLRKEVLNQIWREAAALRDGDSKARTRERRKKGDPIKRWRDVDYGQPHPEAYTILLLELGLGLRRNEADKAQWDWFFERDGKHFLEVKETPYFIPKSRHARVIPVASSLYNAIRATRRRATSFVVSGRKPKRYAPDKEPKNLVYRCDRHHRTLAQWLRQRGVTDAKPCHQLRKEFGSYVATSFGLFHAQKMLGHSSPAVTEAFYAGLTELPALDHTQGLDQWKEGNA